MRSLRTLCLIALCAALLAACGGTPATQNPPVEGATSAPPTSAPADNPTSAPPAAPTERVFETGQPPLPVPGTLVAAATEDPEAGQPYQNVLLERTGGLEGKPLTIQIMNGAVTRDGTTATATPDEVNAIYTLLDQIGFFGLQGVFTTAGAGTDLYSYRLTAERNGASRTIDLQDGYAPPELQRLLDAIVRLGQS